MAIFVELRNAYGRKTDQALRISEHLLNLKMLQDSHWKVDPSKGQSEEDDGSTANWGVWVHHAPDGTNSAGKAWSEADGEEIKSIRDGLLILLVAQLDAQLLSNWRREPAWKGMFDAFDVTLCVVDFLSSAGEAALMAKIAPLSSSYAKERVYVVTQGPKLRTDDGSTLEAQVLTGQALHDKLVALRKATMPKPGEPTPSTKRDREQYCFVFRPVPYDDFAGPPGYFAPTDVVILPMLKHVGLEDLWRPLEWWHYQHESANRRTWQELVEEVGYSGLVLGSSNAYSVPKDGTIWAVYPSGGGYPTDDLADKGGGVPVYRDDDNGQIENALTPTNFDNLGGTFMGDQGEPAGSSDTPVDAQGAMSPAP